MKEAELAAADIVVRPDIPATGGQYGFKDRVMLIAGGEAVDRAAIVAVRASVTPWTAAFGSPMWMRRF
ncbi:MAG: hypothetical protein JNM90_09095 [Burkholderiales bacterium]|nr:hypothetical protein [Burkholderiales bacterium]